MARYQETVDFLNPDSSAFRKSRLPRPAPIDENEDSIPGKLCWGEVGSLPSAELAETVGFEIVKDEEKWTETTRKAEDERIENPDEPEDWVEVNRPTEIKYNATTKKFEKADNTSYDTPDFGGFAPSSIEFTSFTPLGYEKNGKKKVTVTIKNGPRDA